MRLPSRAFIVFAVLILAPFASLAQTMGDLNAAQGLHGTLTRQGANGQGNTIRRAQESVDRANTRHNAWQAQDPDADTDDSGDSSRRRPARSR